MSLTPAVDPTCYTAVRDPADPDIIVALHGGNKGSTTETKDLVFSRVWTIPTPAMENIF
jgi:hypothetical protein